MTSKHQDLSEWLAHLHLTKADLPKLEEAAGKIRKAKVLPDIKKAIKVTAIPCAREEASSKGVLFRIFGGKNMEPGRLCFQSGYRTTEIEIPTEILQPADGVKLISKKPELEPIKEDITETLAAKNADQLKEYIKELVNALGR